jgi:hypothetical protein
MIESRVSGAVTIKGRRASGHDQRPTGEAREQVNTPLRGGDLESLVNFCAELDPGT